MVSACDKCFRVIQQKYSIVDLIIRVRELLVEL